MFVAKDHAETVVARRISGSQPLLTALNKVAPYIITTPLTPPVIMNYLLIKNISFQAIMSKKISVISQLKKLTSCLSYGLAS